MLPILSLFLFTIAAAQPAADTSFHRYRQSIPGSTIGFELVAIPGGSFRMGSEMSDPLAEKDEMPSRVINISPFWMGACEVSYEEYNLFFADASISQNMPTDAVTRPSSPYIDLTLGMGKEGFPANSMQQYGAIMYCKWLYQKTGIFFRLPTEAEWEYACRAGSTTRYFFGDDSSRLSEFAWYAGNSDSRYHQPAQKKPNAWGLYDMLGNVEEWVLDQYQDDFYSSLADSTSDPLRKPEKKWPRIVKGGCYLDDARTLRAVNRIMSETVWNRRDPQIPKSRWWNADAPFVGFRIIRPMQQPTPAEAETFFESYLGF